jgi:hypothetical protein
MYFITKTQPYLVMAWEFRQVDDVREFAKIKLGECWLPPFNLQLICIYHKFKNTHPLEFLGNETPSNKDDSYFLLEEGFFNALEWDPKEWH